MRFGGRQDPTYIRADTSAPYVNFCSEPENEHATRGCEKKEPDSPSLQNWGLNPRALAKNVTQHRNAS